MATTTTRKGFFRAVVDWFAGIPIFFSQVQAERKKVTWPTRRETLMTGVMVVIMTTLLGVFFFIIDTGFEAIVKLLLSLAK